MPYHVDHAGILSIAQFTTLLKQKHKMGSKQVKFAVNSSKINSHDFTSAQIHIENVQVSHETLGNGSFAQVKLGTLISTRGNIPVAVKIILFEDFSDDVIQQALKEVELLMSIKHHTVVECFGYAIDHDSNALLLLLELMNKGTLYRNLKQGFFNENVAAKWLAAYDAACSLLVLHEKNILHRDVKSLNFLLDDDGAVKICDFGMSKISLKSKSIANSVVANIGSTRWKAPETFGAAGKYTLKSDVFSLGMTFFEIATGKVPFDGFHNDDVIFEIRSGNRPEFPSSMDISNEFISIIQACWHQNPEMRPTSEQVVERIEECAWEFFANRLVTLQFKKEYVVQAMISQKSRKLLVSSIYNNFKQADKLQLLKTFAELHLLVELLNTISETCSKEEVYSVLQILSTSSDITVLDLKFTKLLNDHSAQIKHLEWIFQFKRILTISGIFTNDHPIIMNDKPRRVSKIVLLSQSAAGKTSVMDRLRTGKFNEYVTTSAGAALYNLQTKSTTIQVVDLTGQERFFQLAPAFVRNAVVVAIFFPVNFFDFDNLVQYILKCKKLITDENVSMVVVASMLDLIGHLFKSSGREQVQQYCEEQKIYYCELSAKTGQGVNEFLRGLECLAMKHFNDVRQNNQA